MLEERLLHTLPEILLHVVQVAEQEVEGRLHEAIDKIETAKREIEKQVGEMKTSIAEILDDLGDSNTVVGEELVPDKDMSLSTTMVILQERYDGLRERHQRLRQSFEERRKNGLQRAELEGIDQVIIELSALSTQPKLKGWGEVLEKTEREWPERLREARTSRDILLNNCRQLSGLLKEPLLVVTGGSGREVKQRLTAEYERLDRLKTERAQILVEAERVFNELNSEYAIDHGNLSLEYIQSISQRKQEAIRAHREQILGFYHHSLATLRDLLECLSEECPSEYIIPDISTTTDTFHIMDTVHRMRSHCECIRQRAERARSLRGLLQERAALIAEMLRFEKSASDPARLFAPSFRLLQEERFRKSAVPNLRRLEGRLLKELGEFEEAEGMPYTVTVLQQRVLLREQLEKEISERFVNEAVFGFHPDNVKTAQPSPMRSNRRNENSINGTFK